MIRQYAISPACLLSWDSFCRFVDQIGIGHGRLLADFPSSWRSELLRQLKAAGLEQQNQNVWKRITERMATEAFARKFIRREDATYSTGVSWIENAAVEHAKRPFDAVIAKCVPPQSAAVVDPDDITEEHPRWRVERTKTIKMSAGEIIGVVRPLVRVSREILLIDRYLFGFDERTRRASLCDRHFATLRQLATECKCRTMSLVEYHCGDCRGLDDVVVQEFVEKVKASFPSNMDFVLCVWPMGSQHNRLILTDVGGVIFGHGLDECVNPHYPKRDDVALLDDAHWKKRWLEYRCRSVTKPSRVISVIKRR